METLITIKTQAEFRALFDYIKDKDIIAFDVETTGVEKSSQIIGFSICADIDPPIGYYVILRRWDVQQNRLVDLETLDIAKEFLERLASFKLIMQNGGFDCWMVSNNFGVNLIQSLHTDTMVLGHLLNENRSNGLKERGVELFGEDARKEQKEMKESVTKNGGVLNKTQYELYKADAELIARYGAKDAILTLKVFYSDLPQLFEENLDSFFYDEESMPLYSGPTYDMNTTGLRVDPEKLSKLKGELEAECLEQKAFIYNEISPYIKDKYPAKSKKDTFNICSSQQLAWLLFFRLGNEFNALTKSGKELCRALGMKIPYNRAAKKEFIATVEARKGAVWQKPKWNWKTKKFGNAKKVEDPWKYIACGKETINRVAKFTKYKWCETLLVYNKNKKLLNTYVIGIQTRQKYNIIRPSFLQHGTTSGRYSCKNPNFQNLPRDDKRIKSCIIAREGNVFVGADYAQLEPRTFAAMSQDPELLNCFKTGDDFYSTVGAPVFSLSELSKKKDAPNSFAKLHPDLRQISKVIALSATYGTLASKMAPLIGKSIEEAQEVIDRYFEEFPSVHDFMMKAHTEVKKKGRVFNLFGRPRRIPEAMNIKKLYGNSSHAELPYEARTLLNLAVNHKVQSTAASIMNRSAIGAWNMIQENAKNNPLWKHVHIVLQVHDELILEGPKALAKDMVALLKTAMENTVSLPGVDLIAEPKVGTSLAELK